MKVAIIGTGRVAEFHAEAMNQIEPGLLAGGWNRTGSKSEAFCARFGGVSYPDLAGLLDDQTIDAVVVTTATPTHFELAKQALEAGKHVLLEKPPCETSDQVRQLKAVADRTGRICMPSHNYIYAEDVRRLHHHVTSGHLGDVVSFWALFNNYHPPSYAPPDFYMMRELLVHHAYAMLYMLGRPAHVSATGTNIHFDDPTAIDQVMVSATFDSGVIANLWGSFVVEDRAREPWSLLFKVMGTKGTGMAAWDNVKYGPEPEPLWDDAAYMDSFLHVERYFVEQCLQRGAAPLSTLADGVDVLTIVEAVHQSLTENRRVPVTYTT